MIVALDKLKRVLGLPLNSTDQDGDLTDLILLATTWVESSTRRRFDTPIRREEFFIMREHERILLAGHIDESVAADNPSETVDPAIGIRVFRRPVLERFRAWDELVEGTDWERRGEEILWLRWMGDLGCDELKVDYPDGYVKAPLDIAQVVLELAASSYMYQYSVAAGTAGLTSEKLGDFSYTINIDQPGLPGGKLTSQSMDTLKRYRLQVV